MPLSDSKTLRRQAESFLSDPPNEIYAGQLDDVKTLIRDLSLHQVWLETQNQSLRETYQTLLQAKNNFGQLFDLAPAGYLKLDKQGRILFANQTLRELLGVSTSEIQGQYLNRFIHPEDAHIFSTRYPAFFSNPNNKTIELRLRQTRPQSTPPHVQLSARRITEQDELGQSHSRLLVIANDVSELHRQLEEKVLAAKVFETSDEAIVITNGNKQILRVNQSFVDITEYQPSQVIGETLVSVLFASSNLKIFQTLWSKLINVGRWKSCYGAMAIVSPRH